MNECDCRRVHISKATLMCLGDEFSVEPAEDDTRDSYLTERGIETFFIVPQSQTPQLPVVKVYISSSINHH